MELAHTSSLGPIMHNSFKLCFQGCQVSGLKSAMVEVFMEISLNSGLLFFFFFFFKFIYLFMAVLSLHFCARAFSSCGKRGHSSSGCAGLSLWRPLLLRSTGSRRAGSVAVAHGPSWIFPDQGSNPCPLH